MSGTSLAGDGDIDDPVMELKVVLMLKAKHERLEARERLLEKDPEKYRRFEEQFQREFEADCAAIGEKRAIAKRLRIVGIPDHVMKGLWEPPPERGGGVGVADGATTHDASSVVATRVAGTPPTTTTTIAGSPRSTQ